MQKQTVARRRLTTGDLLVAIPVGLIFALVLTPVGDTDFWWHLKAGEWMLGHHAIPRVGLWSWAGETRPWVTHEWLFEVMAAALWRLAGPQGLMGAKAACVAIAFGVVLRHARMRSGSPGIAALLTLAAGIATAPFWGERPQLVTYGLVALFLLLLDGWHRGERRSLWILPPITAVWANLHGAYVLALFLLGCYLMAELAEQAWARWRGDKPRWEKLRHLALVGVASVAATVLNPHGVEVLSYPLLYIRPSQFNEWFSSHVTEWFSPNFRDPRFQLIALFILAAAPALAVSRLRPRAAHLILLPLFAAMTLAAQRNAPLYLIACVPILAEHLGAACRHAQARRAASAPAAVETGQIALINWLAVLVLLGFVAMRLPLSRDQAVDTDSQPVGAIAYLKSHHLPGRMFNYYNWGGYLIWELTPQYQVFVDGRADIYGEKILGDLGDVSKLKPNYREVLEKYRIGWVLWPTDSPLSQLLRISPDWKVVYQDDLAVILVRRQAP